MSAHAGVYLLKYKLSFFLGYASLEDARCTHFIKFPFMNLVGFRLPYNPTCVGLVFGELFMEQVCEERLGPWCNDCHNFVYGSCFLNSRAAHYIWSVIVFERGGLFDVV